MAKLKTWLLHNGTLKAISVAGAFIIWIFVANYSNPLTEDFLETSIITKNAAEFTQGDRVYTLSADTVRVSYKTREKYAGTVKPYEIKAYVDLSGLDRSLSMIKAPVSLEIPEKYDGIIYDVQFEPQNVVISTENIQQKKFAVECMMTGSPAQGYIEGEASLSPEYFYVRGPVSVIGQISSTGIIVDMENATGDVNGNTDIVFYDANGNVLTDIEKSLSFAGVIDYHVPVYRTKSLSVNAFAGGMPATGYTVESVEVSPTFVQVYGSEEALSKNSVIIIPGSAINAAGRKANLT